MFANSKKQLLSMHSIGVAKLSIELFSQLKLKSDSLTNSFSFNVDSFKKDLFLAGILHDLGKIDDNFQHWLINKQTSDQDGFNVDGVHFLEKKEDEQFSFLKYPRHNELSWALSHFLIKNKTSLYAIYYHHAKVKRESEYNKKSILDLFDELTIKDSCNKFFQEVLSYSHCFKNFESEIIKIQNEVHSIEKDCDEVLTPAFLSSFERSEQLSNYKKSPEQIDSLEMRKLLARSLVVSADRIISELSVEELSFCINNNSWKHLTNFINTNCELFKSVENMLDAFKVQNEFISTDKKRDIAQSDIALQISQVNTSAVLFGPAGCGKTKIFLEWYLNKSNSTNNYKKLFIVAPRKMICSSLFCELKDKYVSSATIELLTGEDKLYYDGQNSVLEIEEGKQYNADITITTIDQLVSVLLSHKKIDMLLEFLNSYVVFDEFHEFFNIPGIVLLFKYFIQLKNMLSESNTLLVSATPNYFFIESFLKINKKSIFYIDTFNKQKFNFSFSLYSSNEFKKNDNSILFDNQEKGSIVIFNTATDSQKSSILVQNEKTINFHSKFNSKDKK